jgi:8-oxo-dGTP pyrophosphatase MutT (NUDIX family)
LTKKIIGITINIPWKFCKGDIEKLKMMEKEMEGNFSYRTAALIIKDNQLLVAKNKDHLCYYTVGGGIEIYETSEEAVIREVFEETGLKLEIDRLVFVQERFHKVNEQKFQEVVFFYIMKNFYNFNIENNSYTDQGTKETLHWLSLDELNKINLVPEFLKTKNLNNIDKIEHIISKEW